MSSSSVTSQNSQRSDAAANGVSIRLDLGYGSQN